MLFSILALLCAFASSNGGLLSLRRIAVCQECELQEESSYRCTMRANEPVALVIDCPVASLFTGPSLLVLAMDGEAGNALLMSTVLNCEDVHVDILNGMHCKEATTTTTTTTTTGRWPWPIPGVPVREEDGETTSTTAATTTTIMTSTNSSTTTAPSTTHIIVISTAWKVNETTLFVALAILFTGVGVYVTVRCCLRRRRRRGSMNIRQPVQVQEVSSSTSSILFMEPSSPRRRRQREEIELCAAGKMD